MAPKVNEIADEEDDSSQETQFIPHEDDEELLWEVSEITDEKGAKGKDGQYHVKWKGNDPKTMKPWAQSWVPKCDCTDDLVTEWKTKLKAKKDGKGKTESRKPWTSTATKGSVSVRPKASSSKSASTTRKLRSTTSLTSATGKGSVAAASRQSSVDTVTPSITPKPEEDNKSHSRALDNQKSVLTGTPVPTPAQGAKRKRDALSNHSSGDHTRGTDADLVHDDAEDLPSSKSNSTSNGKTTPKTSQRADTTQPRKKRKIGDPDTPSLASSPPPTHRVSIARARQTRPAETATKPKPSKKRQPKRPPALTSVDPDFRSGDEVEFVKPVKAAAQVEAKEEEPLLPNRSVRGRMPFPQETPAHAKILKLYTEKADGDEEVEVKMVEDALSEVEMEIGVHDDEEEEMEDEDAKLRQTSNGKSASSKIVMNPTARVSVLPKPRIPVSTTSITFSAASKPKDTSSSKSTTSKQKKPAVTFSKPPPIPEDSEEEHEDARPEFPPPAPPTTVKFGPPGRKTKPKEKKTDPNGNKPPVEVFEHFPTCEVSRDSTTPDRERAASRTTASTPPPPLEWAGSSPLPLERGRSSPVADARRPLEEVSVLWGLGRGEGARGLEPLLLPRALERLHRFDRELYKLERKSREGKEKGKTKEKQQEGEGKLDKGKRKSVEEDTPVVISPQRAAASTTTTATTTTKPPSIASAAAAAKSPPPPRTRREGLTPLSNSFGSEVVPGTDQSRSGSQELLPLESTAVVSTSVPPQPPTISRATTPLRQTAAAEPLATPKPTTTLTRTGSIKSRMKPRTPISLSRASSMAALSFPAPPPTHLENKLPTLAEEDPARSIEVDNRMEVDVSINSTQCTNGFALPRPALPANDLTENIGAAIAGVTIAKNGSGKTLKPIPILSPSAFQPYMATLAPVSSLESAQESILDPDDDVPKETGSHEDEDQDSPMSFIEQFYSQQKDQGKRRDVFTLAKPAVKRREGKESEHSRARSQSKISSTSYEVDWDMKVGVDDDDDTPLRSADVVERGTDLAEAARGREKLRTHGSSSSVASATSSRRAKLDFVVSSRAKSRLTEVALIHGYTDEEDGGGDEAQPGSARDAASKQQLETQPQEPPAYNQRSLTIQEPENTYLNLSGGPYVDPLQLRQEEEELTQDLVMELENHQRDIPVDEGWALGPAPAPSSPQPRPESGTVSQENEKLVIEDPNSQKLSVEPRNSPRQVGQAGHGSEIGDAANRVPNIDVERPGRPPSIRPYGLFGNNGPANATTEDLSSLVSRLRFESMSKSPAALLPGRQTRAKSYEPTGGQDTHTRSTKDKASQDLTAAFSLLKAKSEEVSRLDNQLLAAQAKHEDLDQQNQSLCVQLSEVSAASTFKAHELTRQLDAAHAKLATLNPDWETERDALIAKVKATTQAKVSAESDREFFREQCAQASAYVGSVRDENKELEERAQNTEGQATTGVDMIKATFEARTKALEDSVKSWRGVAEFLMEKDRQTNDEIRRKAGEEPELSLRCRRQKANLEELTERMGFMQEELEEKQRQILTSGEELQRWKDETLRLNIEVNKTQMKLEQLGRFGEGHDADGDGHHPSGGYRAWAAYKTTSENRAGRNTRKCVRRRA